MLWRRQCRKIEFLLARLLPINVGDTVNKVVPKGMTVNLQCAPQSIAYRKHNFLYCTYSQSVVVM